MIYNSAAATIDKRYCGRPNRFLFALAGGEMQPQMRSKGLTGDPAYDVRLWCREIGLGSDMIGDS